MSRSWLSLILFAWLLATQVSLGETVELKESSSPDGTYKISAIGGGDAATLVVIQDQKTGATVASCEWGYGVLSSISEYAAVKWSADSKFVAIRCRTSKRTFETTIFFVDGKQTREVKPDLDYFQNICGRLGTLGQDFRNLRVSPLGWKPTKWHGSELTLKVEVPPLKDDFEVAFEVTLDCFPPRSERNSGDPDPHGSVVEITGPLIEH